MPVHSMMTPLFAFIQVGHELYVISMWLAGIATVVTLPIAFIFCWRSFQPDYMKSLPIYLFVSGLTEILALLFEKYAGFIYWLFTLFETIYFSYFFYLLFSGYSRRVLLYVVDIVFILLSVIGVIALPRGYNIALAMLFESALLVVCSIIYYRNILNTRQIIYTARDPSFFMVTGIFFYFLIQIPVTGFSAFYFATHKIDLLELVYSMNNYSLTVSYAFYTKAMVCLKKRS